MALSRLHWKNYHGKAIISKGASGGIATFYNSETKYTMKSTKETNNWILTKLQCKDKQESIFVCNVYGPTHYKDKMIFWETLNLLSENLHGKDVILIGDFNTT